MALICLSRPLSSFTTLGVWEAELETVVFHIGVHKTGTKTIQSFLRQNAEQLTDLYLPRTGCVDPDRYANSHNIAWELRGLNLFRPELGTFQALLSELFNVEQKMAVLSAEDFEFLSADQIAKIADDLSDYKRIALVYLRRHDELIAADYAHHVRAGSVTTSLEDWYAIKERPRYDFLALLNRWKAAGFEVRVRAYEPPAPGREDVCRNFVRALGIDPLSLASLASAESLNVRLSGKVAILTRETMAAIKADFDLGPDSQRLADFIAWHLQKLMPDNERFNPMTDAMRTQICERYAPMYARIEAEYLNGAPLFSTTAEPKPEFGRLDQLERHELVSSLAGIVAVLWLQQRHPQTE